MPVDLTAYDPAFADTEAAPDQMEVPAGTYQVRIAECKLTETKDKNLPMLGYKLTVLAGQYHDKPIYLNQVITGTEQNLAFLKRDLAKLGFSNRPLSQLPNALESFIGLCLEVTRVTKPDKEGNPRTNTYINKIIDPQGIPSSAVPPTGDFGDLPPMDGDPF
jgi:hypothetical protein